MEAWRAALSRGDVDAAWDLFIERYRRLIIASIRRTLDVHEDVPDVFAHVCQALSADGLARLRQYADRPDAPARFSTWLVVVVRNQTIDWMRRRSGRRRTAAPESLSPLQREIFRHVFADRRSHAEAYEILRSGAAPDLSFGAFLRELAETYRLVERSSGKGVLRHLAAPPVIEPGAAPHPQDAVSASEAREHLAEALDALPADVRAALQLFIVEDLPAADVARAVGWRSAKDVYNRVYRSLDRLRQALERKGIRAGDL